MMYSSIKKEETSDGFQIIQKSYSHVIKLIYNQNKCAICGICEIICPKEAISINLTDKTLTIDEVKCVRCGICAYFCMFHALDISHKPLDDNEEKIVIMNTLGGLPDLNSKITINQDFF